jgi:hypothetical protein
VLELRRAGSCGETGTSRTSFLSLRRASPQKSAEEVGRFKKNEDDFGNQNFNGPELTSQTIRFD